MSTSNDAASSDDDGDTAANPNTPTQQSLFVDKNELEPFVMRDEQSGVFRGLSAAAVELFHLEDLCNDEGYPVNFAAHWHTSDEVQFRKWDDKYRMYCGRYLGTDIIPSSDGCCGPNNGPNCPSCQRLETNPKAKMAALRRLFPCLWWWWCDEKDKKMQQLFPELWHLRSTSAASSSSGMGCLPSCNSILAGALRQTSGRFYEAVKLLQEDCGLTKFICPDESGLSLLSEPRTDLPLPHEAMSEQALQHAAMLQESLGASLQEAEFALRTSDNPDEAAEMLLNDLEGVHLALRNERVKRDARAELIASRRMERPKFLYWKLRTDIAIAVESEKLPNASAFDPLSKARGEEEVMPHVIVASRHRMVLVEAANKEGASEQDHCVLCVSAIPSPAAGNYQCQACKLCEGCIQQKQKHFACDDATVVFRCPGQRNGGHLHHHPLSFHQREERVQKRCDIRDLQRKDLGTEECDRVSWYCSRCNWDVCRKCIAHPAPPKYSRRLNRLAAPPSRNNQEDTTTQTETAGNEELPNDRDEDDTMRGFFANITNRNDFLDALVEDRLHALPAVFQDERAEREAAARWEGMPNLSSPDVLVGAGTVGGVPTNNTPRPTQAQTRALELLESRSRQTIPRPTAGLLSERANDALALYRFRSDGTTVAASDLTHAEDLLRRAEAADDRLNNQAICEAVSAGRLHIAGSLLLSQAYAPLSATSMANNEESQASDRSAVCFCGEGIDASPDGAVGCLGGHAMHPGCAADLLLGGGHCPTCRQPLFYSRVAGQEVKEAAEFAKTEISKAQEEGRKRAQQEVEELAKSGTDVQYVIGDVVLISPDVEACRNVQMGDPITGGWDEDMAPSCGLEGHVSDTVKLGERTVAIQVRCKGRHLYRKILLVDDFCCQSCGSHGTSDGRQFRCRMCDECDTCCRRTLRSCPQVTYDWYWSPSVLSLLRRAGILSLAHESVFDSDATEAIGRAERHVLRLRGELIAVKRARESVKEEMNTFMATKGTTNISRELSLGASEAFRDMFSSGVSPADWQRARHLLLLARQWGDSEEARSKRAFLYDAIRNGDIDFVARTVRGYNAFKTAEAARWADATLETAEYVVEPFAQVDLRACGSIFAPKTGFSLAPQVRFFSQREMLDDNGNVWLHVASPSEEDSYAAGTDVTFALAKAGARVSRRSGTDEGVIITTIEPDTILVRWKESTLIESLRSLVFAGPPPAPPQGWLCIRHAGTGPRVVCRTGTKLRCFSCGDRLLPSKSSREKYGTVKGKPVEKGASLLVAATLEPVTVERIEGARIYCLFPALKEGLPTSWGGDNGRSTIDNTVWYRAEDLVFPYEEEKGSEKDDDAVLVDGRMLTRRELVLTMNGNEEVARKKWYEAVGKDRGKDSSTVASCARGHLLHARCFQGALVAGRCCPAVGCREPLWVPSVTKENPNDETACGGTPQAVQAQSEALQAASELAGHEAIVAAREAAGTHEQNFNGAGLDNLKMCPLCCSGPFFNNECSDMQAHHGQCSVGALRWDAENCTPNGIFSVPASEIAARVAQVSSNRSLVDVLPKCETHNAIVIFNGCMACGYLFTDTSWTNLPAWDPRAKASLEISKKARNAARLLTEQVRTEAALLQFERDALWEAKEGISGGGGWGGEDVCGTIEPPPLPPPPSLPHRYDSNAGDY